MQRRKIGTGDVAPERTRCRWRTVVEDRGPHEPEVASGIATVRLHIRAAKRDVEIECEWRESARERTGARTWTRGHDRGPREDDRARERERGDRMDRERGAQGERGAHEEARIALRPRLECGGECERDCREGEIVHVGTNRVRPNDSSNREGQCARNAEARILRQRHDHSVECSRCNRDGDRAQERHAPRRIAEG